MVSSLEVNKKIVDFLYEDDSIVSKIIISYYQDYLSSIKFKKRIELILEEYILKSEFYKYVQYYFNVERNNNLFKDYNEVFNKLNDLYVAYKNIKYKHAKFARWV